MEKLEKEQKYTLKNNCSKRNKKILLEKIASSFSEISKIKERNFYLEKNKINNRYKG